MSYNDRNIVITPNIGSSTEDPKIVFSGADSSTAAQNITLKAYPTSSGTLSFEGSAGQLFSITNSLSGTIFAVNDVSGIPSIEVLDTGTIKFAQYSGNVGIGTSSPAYKLDVSGTANASAVITPSVTAPSTDLTLSAVSTGITKLAVANGVVFTATDHPYSTGGSIVNYPRAFGSQTGYTVGMMAQGSDTNVGLVLSSKGNLPVEFWTNTVGNKQFQVSHTASTVNYAQATGAATGSGPTLSAQGSDTNIDFNIATKGTGILSFYTRAALQTIVSGQSSAVNYLQLNGQTTGNYPAINVAGSDANVGLDLITKGTGPVRLRTGSSSGIQFLVANVDSAVNYIQANGASTTNWPTLLATGSDTNVTFNFVTKGTGVHNFGTGGAGSNSQLRVSHTTSAVNYVNVTGAATGSGPTISAQGSDSNIDFNIAAKGTGSVKIKTGSSSNTQVQFDDATTTGQYTLFSRDNSNNIQKLGAMGSANFGLYATGGGSVRFYTSSNVSDEQFRISHTTSAVNYVQITGSATGNSPVLSAQGSDTNINILLTPKGTGNVGIGTTSPSVKLEVDGNFKISNTQEILTKTSGVEGWGYVNSISITGQETNALGLSMSTDGTKMYIIGSTNDTVYQYTLSTAFDVSTAVYSGLSFSVTTTAGTPHSLFFKPDGTAFYIVNDSTTDTVQQFNLSTAWNISTASYVTSYTFTQDTVPAGLEFSPDGTKMHLIGDTNNTVYQFALSTPWDLTTTATTPTYTFSVATQETAPNGIEFNSDGTKMYIVGLVADAILQYNLSTPWNITTAVYDSRLIAAAGGVNIGNISDIYIDISNNIALLIDNSADRVYQFTTNTNALKVIGNHVIVDPKTIFNNELIGRGNAYFYNPVALQSSLSVAAGASFISTLTASNTISLVGATTTTTSLGTAASTGTLTLGGTGQTGLIQIGQSTATHTLNIDTGATISGATKNIAIGTGGVSGSTTGINIGSSTGTTTTNIYGSTAIWGATSRVGIGTDSGGSITLGRLDNTASSPYLDFNSGATTVDYDTRIMATSGNGTAGNGTLSIYTGTLGIGTIGSTIAGAVHIRRDVDGVTNTIIQNRNGTGTPLSALTFITGSVDYSDNRYAQIVSGGNTSNYLAFLTSNGAAPTEKLRIDASGNVLIGSTTNVNSSKLLVNGTIETTTGVRFPDGVTQAVGIPSVSGQNGKYLSTNGSTVSWAAGVGGATGVQGASGVIGYTGATGVQGIQGASGVIGYTGATGPAGTNGTNGATGPAGTNGTNGTNGATGPTSGTATYIASVDSVNRNAAEKLPTTTPQAVRFDFANASTTGTSGNYAGVMTYAPWTGTTASTGDASYQLAFGSTATNGTGYPWLNIRKGIDSTWNSWYSIPLYGANGGGSTGNLYAGVFYDGSNTSYYVDPASNSLLYSAGFLGGNSYFINNDPSGNAIRMVPSSTGTNSILQWVNYAQNTQWTSLLGYNGYLQASTQFRAPSFYDSDNTAYYVDPASTSTLNIVSLPAGAQTINTTTPGTALYQLNFTGQSTADYAQAITWGWSSSGAQAGIYVQSSGSYGTKIYIATTDSFATGSKTALSIDHTGVVQTTRNYLTATSSLRAPIFYDSDDTYYYCDPSSWSRFNIIYPNGWARSGTSSNLNTDFNNTPAGSMRHAGDDASVTNSPGGTWWFYDHYRHSNTSNYWGTQIAWGWEDNSNRLCQRNVSSGTWSSWVEYLSTGGRTYTGSLTMTSSLTGTIFYDYNNTGYYCDPNSSSYLNVIGAAGRIYTGFDSGVSNSISCSAWFRSNGTTGWFNDSYGGGIYQIDTVWVRIYNSKALYVANEIAATGNITAYYSDERLKTNLGNISNSIDIIKSLNGFRYVNNELAKSVGYSKEEIQLGVSAQEVQQVLPEIVSLAPFDMETSEFDGIITSKSGENYLTVDYARLVPVLIEAIKELIERVEKLENN
jgi:hypothetical protein